MLEGFLIYEYRHVYIMEKRKFVIYYVIPIKYSWFKLMMSMQFLWKLLAKRAEGITKASREKAKD